MSLKTRLHQHLYGLPTLLHGRFFDRCRLKWSLRYSLKPHRHQNCGVASVTWAVAVRRWRSKLLIELVENEPHRTSLHLY